MEVETLENEATHLKPKESTVSVRKKINMRHVRKFFDMSTKGEYSVDDQTWDDLDMDSVFLKIDKTQSSSGKSSLYCMLRNILTDEEKLKERDGMIELFQKNNNLKNKLENIFLNLGRDRKNTFLDLLDSEVVVNKFKYYIYTILGKVFPLICILCAIFLKEPKFILVYFV
jgi:hypothetical protein